jgi:hypothetical protein
MLRPANTTSGLFLSLSFLSGRPLGQSQPHPDSALGEIANQWPHFIDLGHRQSLTQSVRAFPRSHPNRFPVTTARMPAMIFQRACRWPSVPSNQPSEWLSAHSYRRGRHMPVTRSDLTEQMTPRGRRAEYTRKCGWIDWAHADKDRDDLNKIWSAFDPPPRGPNGKIDPDRVSLIRGPNGGLYSYLKVELALEMNWKLRFINEYPKRNFTFFVKVQEGSGTAFYQRAALSIFLYGCILVEAYQGNLIAEWKAHSSFSMEDMISNLMAFYQLVKGINPETMIEHAGGWIDRNDALKNSTAVFEAMESKDAPQPKSKGHVFDAYLFNDIAGIDDRRGGWQRIPDYFTSIVPIPFNTNDDPPADIGYEWDEAD